MGTRKNATYKVHNGVDFDEIMFQTIADQVLITKDGMTLGEFLRNGGTIGGGYLGAFANGLVFGKDGIPDSRVQTLYSGDINMFGPSVTKKVSLGYDTNAWKEAWIGSYLNASNGYTTLPNGFILQWGTYEDTSLNVSTYYNTTFPITFPTTLLNSFISAYAWDNNSNVILTTARSTGSSNSYLQVRANSASNSTIVKWGFRWVAIGY